MTSDIDPQGTQPEPLILPTPSKQALLTLEASICSRSALKPPTVRGEEWVEMLPIKWACKACHQVMRGLPSQPDLTKVWEVATGKRSNESLEGGLSYKHLSSAMSNNPQLPPKTSPAAWHSLLQRVMQTLLMGKVHDSACRASFGQEDAWRIFDYFFAGDWLPHDASPGEDRNNKTAPNYFWHRFHQLSVPARYVELGAFYRRAAPSGQIINLSGYSKFYGGDQDSRAIDHIWNGFAHAASQGAQIYYVVPTPTPSEIQESLKSVCANIMKYVPVAYQRSIRLVTIGDKKSVMPNGNEILATELFTRHWRYTGVRTSKERAFVGIRTALRGGILHRSVETMRSEEDYFWEFIDAHVMTHESTILMPAPTLQQP